MLAQVQSPRCRQHRPRMLPHAVPSQAFLRRSAHPQLKGYASPAIFSLLLVILLQEVSSIDQTTIAKRRLGYAYTIRALYGLIQHVLFMYSRVLVIVCAAKKGTHLWNGSLILRRGWLFSLCSRWR